jgi:hypothetical protein
MSLRSSGPSGSNIVLVSGEISERHMSHHLCRNEGSQLFASFQQQKYSYILLRTYRPTQEDLLKQIKDGKIQLQIKVA